MAHAVYLPHAAGAKQRLDATVADNLSQQLVHCSLSKLKVPPLMARTFAPIGIDCRHAPAPWLSANPRETELIE
jgi:hypothetical protein